MAGAAPASAQPEPTLALCNEPTVGIVCDAVARQVDHVEQEIAAVPGYIETIRGTVLGVYDNVTARIRCIISGECPE